MWTEMKDVPGKGRKKTSTGCSNEPDLHQSKVHDMTVRFWSFCHPEPGPELNSGSIEFGILVFGLGNLGFKALSCERGSLL